jgi:hypothetical protein
MAHHNPLGLWAAPVILEALILGGDGRCASTAGTTSEGAWAVTASGPLLWYHDGAAWMPPCSHGRVDPVGTGGRLSRSRCAVMIEPVRAGMPVPQAPSAVGGRQRRTDSTAGRSAILVALIPADESSLELLVVIKSGLCQPLCT